MENNTQLCTVSLPMLNTSLRTEKDAMKSGEAEKLVCTKSNMKVSTCYTIEYLLHSIIDKSQFVD